LTTKSTGVYGRRAGEVTMTAPLSFFALFSHFLLLKAEKAIKKEAQKK
jgi:hypothetical protein